VKLWKHVMISNREKEGEGLEEHLLVMRSGRVDCRLRIELERVDV
jgi:hypothetical protein